MHGINQCYAQYYNKRYKRRDHVFADRFKSIIVDDATFQIVDSSFVLSQFSYNIKRARELYIKFAGKCNDPKMKAIVEFEHEGSEYRSERKILVRNFTPQAILEFAANYCDSVTPEIFHIKGKKGAKEFRAVCILLMRSLCSISYREICALAGNISISQACNLCSAGFNIIKRNVKYQNIIDDDDKTLAIIHVAPPVKERYAYLAVPLTVWAICANLKIRPT